ncbi:MAG TPA: hypothetical protein VI911_08020 [Patescibacteria group bacterium]|nr:hypothetical protein [Patescibacteria group bacterium]
MINLTFTLDSIATILSVFDRIQLMRYSGIGIPQTPVDVTYYTAVSGTDQISNITDTDEIILLPQYSQYYFMDPSGAAADWYTSRYYSSSTGSVSGWTDPILGEAQDLYYDPAYPPEIEYGTADQLIIKRIRLLIGDPIGLDREYGDEAESSIMPDGRTYVLDEKGWPAFVNMNGVQYTETANPSINGYRYLRFNGYIDTPVTVISGGRMIQSGVDIWYYTFRWSDREIMEAYDNTPPPPPLTAANANAEIYMLACAYDLLMSETWDYVSEDGAIITDENSKYDPSPGIRARKELLDAIRKRLDDAIHSVRMLGIGGVRID